MWSSGLLKNFNFIKQRDLSLLENDFQATQKEDLFSKVPATLFLPHLTFAFVDVEPQKLANGNVKRKGRWNFQGKQGNYSRFYFVVCIQVGEVAFSTVLFLWLRWAMSKLKWFLPFLPVHYVPLSLFLHFAMPFSQKTFYSGLFHFIFQLQ